MFRRFNFFKTAHHALLVLGIGAIVAWALMFVRPEIADDIKMLSPFAAAEVKDAETEETPANASSFTGFMHMHSMPNQLATPVSLKIENTPRHQQWIATWLSKRYRVTRDAIGMLVSTVYLTAHELKLDPLLVLAVMAIESGFNPFAESPVGAQGLMQVMSKVHHDKFKEMGGIKAAFNPVANIRVGSLILKDYVARGGSIEAGLKMYVGAGAFDNDAGYGARVLAEYRRLKEVSTGKKVPVYSTVATAPAAKTQPNLQTSPQPSSKPENARADNDVPAPTREETAPAAPAAPTNANTHVETETATVS